MDSGETGTAVAWTVPERGWTSAEPPGTFRRRSARRAEIVGAGLDELFARLDVARHPEVTADDGIVADCDAAKYG